MNDSRLSRRRSPFVALIGMGLLMVYPVHAQNPPTNLEKNDKPVRVKTANVLLDADATASRLLADVEATYLNELVLARVHDAADATLGATLQPVGDALRAQLDLPVGQGLVVASLREDSPSAQAG